jgi:amino acid permease
VLGILLNIVGSTLIVTWVATIVSHLILRRRAERDRTTTRAPVASSWKRTSGTPMPSTMMAAMMASAR